MVNLSKEVQILWKKTCLPLWNSLFLDCQNTTGFFQMRETNIKKEREIVRYSIVYSSTIDAS